MSASISFRIFASPNYLSPKNPHHRVPCREHERLRPDGAKGSFGNELTARDHQMDLALFEVKHSPAELCRLLRRAKLREAAPLFAGYMHEHGLLSRFPRVRLIDSVLVISRVGDSRSDSE